MRYLDDTDFTRFAAEREQIRQDMIVKLSAPDFWAGSDGEERGLHELNLLRLGWQMHVEEADRRIAEAVRFMHDAMGSSWAEIGKAMGVSKQAAQKRWGVTKSA